jgi:hypothetical protein
MRPDFLLRLDAWFWGKAADRCYRSWQRCCARAWTAEHQLRIQTAMDKDGPAPF